MAGDLGGSGKLGGGPELPKIQKIDLNPKKAVAKPDTAPAKDPGKISKENKLYKKPAASQESFVGEKSQTQSTDLQKSKDKGAERSQKANQETEAGQKKDYEIKNVGVEAQLKKMKDSKRKPKVVRAKAQADKSSPPKMSLKTRLSPKGPINPRRPKPAIPNRLQSVTDLDAKEMLEHAANLFESAADNPNLISQYAKQLLGKEGQVEQQSIASLLGFNESLVDSDINDIKSTLAQLLESSEVSEEFKTILADVLAQLEQPQANMLKPFLQLFLPIPLPFIFTDIDEAFEIDEEELLDEEFEEDEDSSDEEKKEEKEFNEDFEPDVEASISIKTINYGKMFFHLVHDNDTNKFKLSVKADESAEELALVIENGLEASLGNAKFLNDEVRAWHDNVLRITESRALQINSIGHLNPSFMHACNKLLETVHINDADIDITEIDADYKLL